jgi:dynein heavy chain
MPRGDWLMHKKPNKNNVNPEDVDASDPAQIILLTLAIYYVQEVEEAFEDIRKGNKLAMQQVGFYFLLVYNIHIYVIMSFIVF